MTGERKLASAIINQAVRDFNSVSDPFADRHKPRTERERIGKALSHVRVRIGAGCFLIERMDAAARFWFHLSGVDLTGARSRMPKAWQPRLERLRLKETELMRVLHRWEQKAA
jgi:hypothetical protein